MTAPSSRPPAFSDRTGASAMHVKQVRVVDSHTAGEPTRVVIDGGPDLGSGSVAQRLERFRADFDHFRSGIVNEPQGIGCPRRRAAVRARRCKLRRRRDLLQQRRLHRHVRPRNDRPRRHARAPGQDRRRHPSHRDPRRHRDREAARPRARDGEQRAKLSLRLGGEARRSRGMARSSEMSPGAATGSFWSKRAVLPCRRTTPAR